MILFRCSNNGVVLLVTEEGMEELDRQRRDGCTNPPRVPLFVFTENCRPGEGYTGDFELMHLLTRGHIVVDGRSLGVPLSNSFDHTGLTAEECAAERSDIATVAEVIATFDLAPLQSVGK